MKISHGNFDAFCRICLAELDSREDSSAADVKYHIHKEKHVALWIFSCTVLTVSKNDGLPKYICQMCYNNLRSFNEFQELSMRSWCELTRIIEASDKLDLLDDESRPAETEMNGFEEVSLSEMIKVESLEVARYDGVTLELQMENDHGKIQTDDDMDTDNKEREDAVEENDDEHVNSYIELVIEKCTPTTMKNNGKNASSHRRRDKAETNDAMKALATRPKYGLKFGCEHCQRRYLNHENLEAHVRSVHLGLPPYQCAPCGCTFSKSYQLQTHKREVHSDKAVLFTCPSEDCGKVFARKDSLKKHYYVKHTAENEILCEYEGCGKLFRRVEYYKNHYRATHTDQPKCKYICEDCGYTFKSKDLLRKHRCKQISEEKYPFKCEYCEKRYTSLPVYKGHLLRHSGIKNFECPHCGAKKTTQDELNKHINYHTKERQWQCQLCPKVFNSSMTLGKHDRIVHKGIKRYACRFCDQRFGKPDGLKHHEMRHTGERPHACTLCGRRFIQVVALRAHMRTHGKTREEQMPIPKMTSNRVKIVENFKME